MIWNAIMKLVWFLFVQGPLNLIAAFSKVLEYLTGGIINDILFGSAKDFQWNNIPIQFWWFVVISICIFSLIFTIQMIILMFNEATKTKTKFILAIQNGLKAFIFMFLIPIFFFLANFIIQNLANTIINNFANNSNIAQYLWHIGDSTWDGTTNAVPDSYGYPDNINQYNMLAQIFGTWFMLFAVFMIGIILVQKIIELFFLFVISPIVMIVMVIDDGKAAFTWKDMVIAKFLASTGTLIGYYIFISVTQVLLSSDLNGLEVSNFSKSLFIILYLCGGGLATIGFSDMIAHFVGESAGIREGLHSFRSTVAGGMMAIGAAKMASKAAGFVKSKRAQKEIYGSALNGSYNASTSDLNQGLNFASFVNANKGLSSRAGIIGLAGLALGAAAVGFSNFKVGKKLGGVRVGMKHFGHGVTKAVVNPVKVVGENFNPGLIKFSKTKITQDYKKFKESVNTDTTNTKISKEDSQLIESADSSKRTKRVEKKNSKLDTSEKK